jgi:protein SCO1/2
MCRILPLVAVIILSVGQAVLGQVLRDDDPALRGIDVEERLGDTIPFDVTVVNDRGDTTTIGAYLGDGKPVVLIMAYYTCPMLCNLILNGVSDAVANLSLTPGEEYRILTVSIAPTETVELATAKKENYIENLGMDGVADAWTFFVAAEDQSRKLADAIGFKYYWDEDQKQYAHTAVLTVLSPDGVISRYTYGIEYNPRDLRLALLEASEGEIGTTIDRILLYCYRYDPDAGGYALIALNVMKLGGAATLAVLFLFLGIFWMREFRRKSRSNNKSRHRVTG